MKAYSVDLRTRIVEAVSQGMSQAEAARVFSVGLSSVKRYVRQQQQTGRLRPKPIPGRRRSIGPTAEAALQAQVARLPDARLEEHCATWAVEQGRQVSVSTMARSLRRARLTRKKSR
jgi:transposase